MTDIWKGNLGNALKQDIIEVLRDMMASENKEDQKFAITTLLSHKRDLSDWPAASWDSEADVATAFEYLKD